MTEAEEDRRVGAAMRRLRTHLNTCGEEVQLTLMPLHRAIGERPSAYIFHEPTGWNEEGVGDTWTEALENLLNRLRAEGHGKSYDDD